MQCFETEALMHSAGAVAPVLTYLFHRLGDTYRRNSMFRRADEAVRLPA